LGGTDTQNSGSAVYVLGSSRSPGRRGVGTPQRAGTPTGACRQHRRLASGEKRSTSCYASEHRQLQTDDIAEAKVRLIASSLKWIDLRCICSWRHLVNNPSWSACTDQPSGHCKSASRLCTTAPVRLTPSGRILIPPNEHPHGSGRFQSLRVQP
jgi:hypothetical protein